MIRVGDVVRADGRTGTVTYIHHAIGDVPFAVTVCVGPSAFDLIHPKPESVVAA
jgi:hypothetical protein